MKTIDLQTESWNVLDLLPVARNEPVLLLGPKGEEYLLAPADDFEREVASLRNNEEFQRFLDERSRPGPRIPIADVLAEIEGRLSEVETFR